MCIWLVHFDPILQHDRDSWKLNTFGFQAKPVLIFSLKSGLIWSGDLGRSENKRRAILGLKLWIGLGLKMWANFTSLIFFFRIRTDSPSKLGLVQNEMWVVLGLKIWTGLALKYGLIHIKIWIDLLGLKTRYFFIEWKVSCVLDSPIYLSYVTLPTHNI